MVKVFNTFTGEMEEGVISRWRNKNGIADLEKIKHYIDLLIELEDNYGNK